MSNVIIVQARMGSTRLPQKMQKMLCGKRLIDRVLERVGYAQHADVFVLAIPDSNENEILAEAATRYNFRVFKGSEIDLLDRFYQAAHTYAQDGDAIIRVCADNPFIAPEEIDRLIDFYSQNQFDYAFNHVPAANNRYPDGLGAEILSFSVLGKLWQETTDVRHREHVSSHIWDNLTDYCVGILSAPKEIACPFLKLDVDTLEDYEWVERVYDRLVAQHGEKIFSAVEIVTVANYLKTNCKSF